MFVVLWELAEILWTLGKNGPLYSLLSAYKGAHKISSIYWVYGLYKGFIKLYQKLSISLMSTRNRRRMSQVWSFLQSAVVYLVSAYRWMSQRKAFGNPLNKQAIVRSKLAQMIQYVESMQTWLENITYQMNDLLP